MTALSYEGVGVGGRDLSYNRKITNVATVPQLSPFRYPGGKTWLVPQIRQWLAGLQFRPTLFVEPFAGGGIASLIAVMEDWADRALMCEIDPDVASVWETILTEPDWLVDRILAFEITRQAVEALLSQEACDRRERAFRTLVRNRTQRGGVMAPGASLMKMGENGKGIASRWYPETLAKRIRRIAQHRDRITFVCGDGMEVIRRFSDLETAVMFVDPPYTAGGKRAGRRLYLHSDVDHELLFDLMAQIRGKFLMTYDAAVEVVNMARARGFAIDLVPMKNGHHETMMELLITNPH